MYKKLLFQNVKKSIKDYLIYILTCTLSVAMLYAFLSITSPYYKTNLPSQFNLDLLRKNLKIPLIIVSFLLIFLIRYVNNYILNKKKKEFALQSILGMETYSISCLFFFETLTMGLIAIFLGIILGAFISQIISIIAINAFNCNFKIQNSVYPDTVLITTISFISLFLLVGLGNILEISKLKVIDMLNDTKIMESNKDNKWRIFLYIIGLLISCVVFLVVAILTFIKIYDRRFNFTSKIAYYGSIVAPSIMITYFILYFIYNKLNSNKENKFGFQFLCLISIFGFLNSIFGILLFGAIQGFNDKLLPVIRGMYLLIPIVLIIFTTFIFCMAFSKLVNFIKIKFQKFYFRNIFLFGQLNAKVNRNSVSTAIITLTLFGGILTLCLSSILSKWAIGYLDIRAVHDISINSIYNKIYNKSDLLKESYSFDYLDKIVLKNGYSINKSINVPLFFMSESDFWIRDKRKFPVLAIRESDFNSILKSQNLPSVKLKKDEFAVQWHKVATNDEIKNFDDKNKTITIDEKKLTRLKQKDFHYRLGENIYNSYTNCVIILKDEMTKDLIVANICHFVETNVNITYNDAVSIEKEMKKVLLEENNFSDENISIRLKTLQKNAGIQGSIVIKLILTYVGMLLLIICFTVLSLQQLSDSSEHKYRFNLLYKLGMDITSIRKIILKQMCIWFSFPIIIAMVLSNIVLYKFTYITSSQLSAYIGMSYVRHLLFTTYSIIGILFTIYFLSTWILFNRNIELENN